MNQDPLESLLRAADERAGLPEMPADLAARVRRRAARRRNRWVGGVSTAAAILLCLSLWKLGSTAIPPVSSPDSEIAALEPANSETIQETREIARSDAAKIRAEIDRLNREANFQSTLVRELSRAGEVSRLLKEIHRRADYNEQACLPDAVANVRRQADEAAYVVVAHADRMCRDLHQSAAAAERYRWVAEYFPESCWAAVARRRLAELNQKGEIS